MKTQASLAIMVGLITYAFAMPTSFDGSSVVEARAPSPAQDCVHMLSDCGANGVYKCYNVCFGDAANQQRCQVNNPTSPPTL